MESLSLLFLSILIIFLFYIFVGRIVYNIVFKNEDEYELNNFPLALIYSMLWPIGIIIFILVSLIKNIIYISDSVTPRVLLFIDNTIERIKFYI